jgi:hypothetical protein
MRDIDVKNRSTHRVDEYDMEVAVVPAHDAGPVFVAEVDLTLQNHCRATFF